MKHNPLKVAVLCGGQSTEHEISLRSACFILDTLHKIPTYDLSLLFIDKQGKWFYLKHYENFFEADWQKKLQPIYLLPSDRHMPFRLLSSHEPVDIDLVFPILHGVNGEDGVQQGLLEALAVPYVGSSILGSSICMNKDVSKRLLRQAHINVADWVTIQSHEMDTFDAKHIVRKFGLPLMVKPTASGSSVGVAKVHTIDELIPFMKEAFRYDSSVMIEKFIHARELECSVLGNELPCASNVGEIIPINHEFYSYRAKYIDKNGAELKIPAKLSHSMLQLIKDTAIKTFKTLCCDGMARIDFFLTAEDQLLVNEANTIPGFTSISMYPKLWLESGVSNTRLVEHLIKLALERFERQSALTYEYHE
jgi:D-alanine-D-alanine ligase